MTTKLDAAIDEATPVSAGDAFAAKNHYFDYRHRHEMFVSHVLWEIEQRPEPATVLDIGCGHGIARHAEPQRWIASRAGEFWGVEPDPTVELQPIFHRDFRSLLEQADIPDASVDVAYSFMVLEHVENPAAFLKTIARILKPGGVFLSGTINGRSYMARISRLCGSLRIQDAVLKMARGAEEVEAYHYPAVYRMNTEDQLQAILRRQDVGLKELDVALLERGESELYFPRPLRWIGRLATKAVRTHPRYYTNLLLRLRKPN